MRKSIGIVASAIILIGLANGQRLEAAVPIINSLSPSTKEAGSGAFVMTVTGRYFTSGSVVRWNGTSISTGYVSSTQLNASVASSYIASTGTANITVYTSGRKGGTSNTLTFTIVAPTTTAPPPPPPPPPAPTPLSITTSSLPGGAVNGSFNSTVAATGGTPAYGWSLVSGGGALPPGLVLQTNGTISGTPSQSGTFTFTTQATDQGSQIAQKVLSITVGADPNAPPPPPPDTTTGGIVFQDDFENDFTKWGSVTDPRVKINTNPSFVRKGSKSAQFYYYICGDSTNTACKSEHQDDNHNIMIYRPEGLPHFFLRGYVYLKRPEPGGTTDNLGRKLFYVWADPSGPGTYWSAMLAVRGANGANNMSWTVQSSPIGGGSWVYDCGTAERLTGIACNMQYDTWYSVEMEIKNNTAPAAPWNGEVRVWVNGEKVLELLGRSLNRQYNYPLKVFLIGDQVDRMNYNPVNEYRYWDDIVLSTTYVGP